MKKIIFLFSLYVLSAGMYAQNLAWVKSMGSTGVDLVQSIAVDAYGNVYSTGTYSGTVDFNPGAGVSNLTSGGSSDLFVLKLDSTGNFIWAKGIVMDTLGSKTTIGIDDAGDPYITGGFRGTVDFDPGAGVQTASSIGSKNIFILKLDAAGTFQWVKTMGGSGEDEGVTISGKDAPYIYIAGSYEDTFDFDAGPNTVPLTSAGMEDVFLAKFSAAGALIFVKSVGGTGTDIPASITLDNYGLGSYIVLTGMFNGTVDINPNPAVTHTVVSAGLSDIFVIKLTKIGDYNLGFAMGGPAEDEIVSLTIDDYGYLYTTGSFSGTADFDPWLGTHTLTSTGSNKNMFICKLENTGTFMWAKNIAATHDIIPLAMAMDSYGNNYTAGYFGGTANFNLGAGTNSVTASGTEDIFILKFNNAGFLLWVKSFGGLDSNRALSLALDGSGNAYTAGYYEGVCNFNTAGTTSFTSAGNRDAFILKLHFPPGTVGLETIEGGNNLFSAYPNPTTGMLTVTSANVINLSLINNIGQTMRTFELKNETDHLLNLEGLAPGIYFLTGQTTSGYVSQKIIVTE